MTEGGFQRAIAPSPTFYTTWGITCRSRSPPNRDAHARQKVRYLEETRVTLDSTEWQVMPQLRHSVRVATCDCNPPGSRHEFVLWKDFSAVMREDKPRLSASSVEMRLLVEQTRLSITLPPVVRVFLKQTQPVCPSSGKLRQVSALSNGVSGSLGSWLVSA